jgi:hypothetical protein
MKLLCRSFGAAIVLHLNFTNRVHEFDAGKNDARTPETFETIGTASPISAVDL